jgi:hypothetical protein
LFSLELATAGGARQQVNCPLHPVVQAVQGEIVAKVSGSPDRGRASTSRTTGTKIKIHTWVICSRYTGDFAVAAVAATKKP